MSQKHGTTALDLINASEKAKPQRPSPAPEDVPIKPPERLCEAQQAIWREVSGTIDIKPCDVFLLEVLCGLVDQQRTLQSSVDRDGPIVTQVNGRQMHNPAATALRQLEPQITRCLKELGMSPATRARLKLDNRTKDSGHDSAWADF